MRTVGSGVLIVGKWYKGVQDVVVSMVMCLYRKASFPLYFRRGNSRKCTPIRYRNSNAQRTADGRKRKQGTAPSIIKLHPIGRQGKNKREGGYGHCEQRQGSWQGVSDKGKRVF